MSDASILDWILIILAIDFY